MQAEEIKVNPHFRLDVHLNDHIRFECELENKGIGFLREYEQIGANRPRYFLLDSDRLAIDKIITENGINTALENSPRVNIDLEPIQWNRKTIFFALFILVLISLGLILRWTQ